jgi:alginate O-acetyltransferase complex protein AlgI
MVFSSPIFLFVLLPATLVLHALVPQRARNALLLAVSLIFYSWGEGAWIGLMLLSMVVNHRAGIWIEERRGDDRFCRRLVAVVVAVNIGMLVLFKYTGFIVDNLRLLFPSLPVVESLHLPLGISFYTFHALSYVIDIYRGKAPAQRSLMRHALYISFFPQLVAGPIVRYREICDQLERREVTVDGFTEGIRRFVTGLAKKVLIANTVAVPADAIFGAGASVSPSAAWLGAVAYAIQIYFDFSGYSDMAVGLARMFGFRFPENFQWPYASTSMTDFWRRWHTSLSAWFRDYVYVPLGGNRLGLARTLCNLVAVFLLCGLWHGASWTFVVWGAWHGAFLVLERLTGFPGRSPLRRAYVLAVVLVGWVFFRSKSLADAGAMLLAMAGMSSGAPASAFVDRASLLALAAGALFSFPVATPALAWLWRRLNAPAWQAVEAAGWLLLLAVSGGFVAAGTYNPFIYYRF